MLHPGSQIRPISEWIGRAETPSKATPLSVNLRNSYAGKTMSTIAELPPIARNDGDQRPRDLSDAITWEASKHTYYTIRLLVDRDRVDDAYRAYGYFRWVDDVLDADSGSSSERKAFLDRKKSLL